MVLTNQKPPISDLASGASLGDVRFKVNEILDMLRTHRIIYQQ